MLVFWYQSFFTRKFGDEIFYTLSFCWNSISRVQTITGLSELAVNWFSSSLVAHVTIQHVLSCAVAGSRRCDHRLKTAFSVITQDYCLVLAIFLLWSRYVLTCFHYLNLYSRNERKSFVQVKYFSMDWFHHRRVYDEHRYWTNTIVDLHKTPHLIFYRGRFVDPPSVLPTFVRIVRKAIPRNNWKQHLCRTVVQVRLSVTSIDSYGADCLQVYSDCLTSWRFGQPDSLYFNSPRTILKDLEAIMIMLT